MPYVAPPAYPTPNYDAFGQTIGNLPNRYRQAQADELALQQANLQMEAQKAFSGGIPMTADGQPDYAKMMQTLGGKANLNTLLALGKLATEQQLIQGAPIGQLYPGVAPAQPQPGPSAAAPMALPGAAIPGDRAANIAKVRQWAAEAGRTPEETNQILATAAAESGLKGGAVGDQGSSFGLFQGHVGGLAPGGNRVAGLGDDFMKETGMTLEQFRSPAGQDAFDKWVVQNWDKYGKSDIFHAQKTPAYRNALAYLNRQSGGGVSPVRTASLETGVATDAVPSIPPVSAAAGGSIPRATGGGAAPAGGGVTPQPLVPQVPLPKGFTDPQQAILALDQMMGHPAATPGQIASLKDWRDRIAGANMPLEVRPGQTFVDPRTRQVLFQGPYPGAGMLSPQATENAAETFLKTGKLPPGIGRGAQGVAEIAQITNRAAEIAKERGIEPSKIAESQQAFGARAGGLRQVFQRATGLALVENEASRLVPRVRDLLPKLDHTKYPTINAAINAYRKATGDENIIKFGISAESLSSVYARILKGGGTPTGGETERAHALLDKAWSEGQIGAALDQMELELQSAKQSTDDTLREFGLSTKDIGAEPAAPIERGKTETPAQAGKLPAGWSVEVH